MIRLQDNPPVCWPESLLSAGDGVAACAWSIAYCKPRQEKALAWDLVEREAPYFLPMVVRQTSSGGRRRSNYYPLFASYLFFPQDPRVREVVLRTNRVLHVIDPAAVLQPTLHQELAALAAAVRTRPERVELHPRLVPGAKVQIKSGPLKGLQGVILNCQNMRKLWLGVSVLGAGATVEIPADLVESWESWDS